MDNDQEKQSTPETETNVPQQNEPTSADPTGVETQDSVPDPTPVEDPTPPADQTPEPAMAAAAQISPEPKKSPKKLILGVIIALVVVVLGVVAWTLLKGDKSDDDKARNSTTNQIQPIAELKVGGQDGPIGVNHIFPEAPVAEMSLAIDFQVFEGLVGYNDQRISPLLATSWTNPDNNTWVFELKKGVTFQNGKALTAESVKSSLDADIKNEGFGQYLSTVKTVSVTGPNQVTITTSSPDALLLNRLAYGFIFSENSDGSVSGTGAYTVDTANSKAEDKTRLVAYDSYHQGVPKTKVVSIQVYEKQDELNKEVQEGKVDIMSDIFNSTFAQTAAAKNIKSVNYDSNGPLGIEMNMLKSGSPLQKLEVREALAYALDRDAYTKESGKAGDLRVATNYIVPKSVIGYNEAARFPDTDVTKVKGLLTKAGYANGVNLTFAYIKGIQPGVPGLAKQLTEAGFKVTAKPYNTPDEFVAAVSKGDFDLMLLSYSTDLGDALDTFSNLLGSNGQFPSYSNKQFDDMISDAEQTFKPDEHLEKVQEVNKYVADNYLWIPVANRTFSVYYPGDYNYTLESITGLVGTYYWKLGQVVSQTNN